MARFGVEFPLDNRPLLVVNLEAKYRESRTTPSGEPRTIRNTEIIEFGCALVNRNGDRGL